MIHLEPKTLLVVGFILMVIGVALPFLTIIRVLESTFLSNFLAFTAQTVGLLMGTIGLIFHAGLKKR